MLRIPSYENPISSRLKKVYIYTYSIKYEKVQPSVYLFNGAKE